MSNPKYLDLDAVREEFEFTVKLHGAEHKVVQSSLADFIENAKLIEALAVGASPQEELEVTIKILAKAIPTADEGEVRKLTFNQLEAIRVFVMTANGEVAEKNEAHPAEDADVVGNVDAVS